MLEFNTKVLGGRNDLGYESKARRVVRHSPSGATYAWLENDPDDTTVSTPPAPSWDDDAALRRAKEAGAAALAANPMRRTRRPDGKFGCGTCAKCTYRRYDLCPRPLEPLVAKSIADQTFGDAIARAEADAADNARVVWQQQVARGMEL